MISLDHSPAAPRGPNLQRELLAGAGSLEFPRPSPTQRNSRPAAAASAAMQLTATRTPSKAFLLTFLVSALAGPAWEWQGCHAAGTASAPQEREDSFSDEDEGFVFVPEAVSEATTVSKTTDVLGPTGAGDSGSSITPLNCSSPGGASIGTTCAPSTPASGTAYNNLDNIKHQTTPVADDDQDEDPLKDVFYIYEEPVTTPTSSRDQLHASRTASSDTTPMDVDTNEAAGESGTMEQPTHQSVATSSAQDEQTPPVNKYYTRAHRLGGESDDQFFASEMKTTGGSSDQDEEEWQLLMCESEVAETLATEAEQEARQTAADLWKDFTRAVLRQTYRKVLEKTIQDAQARHFQEHGKTEPPTALDVAVAKKIVKSALLKGAALASRSSGGEDHGRAQSAPDEDAEDYFSLLSSGAGTKLNKPLRYFDKVMAARSRSSSSSAEEDHDEHGGDFLLKQKWSLAPLGLNLSEDPVLERRLSPQLLQMLEAKTKRIFARLAVLKLMREQAIAGSSIYSGPCRQRFQIAAAAARVAAAGDNSETMTNLEQYRRPHSAPVRQASAGPNSIKLHRRTSSMYFPTSEAVSKFQPQYRRKAMFRSRASMPNEEGPDHSDALLEGLLFLGMDVAEDANIFKTALACRTNSRLALLPFFRGSTTGEPKHAIMQQHGSWGSPQSILFPPTVTSSASALLHRGGRPHRKSYERGARSSSYMRPATAFHTRSSDLFRRSAAGGPIGRFAIDERLLKEDYDDDRSTWPILFSYRGDRAIDPSTAAALDDLPGPSLLFPPRGKIDHYGTTTSTAVLSAEYGPQIEAARVFFRQQVRRRVTSSLSLLQRELALFESSFGQALIDDLEKAYFAQNEKLKIEIDRLQERKEAAMRKEVSLAKQLKLNLLIQMRNQINDQMWMERAAEEAASTGDIDDQELQEFAFGTAWDEDEQGEAKWDDWAMSGFYPDEDVVSDKAKNDSRALVDEGKQDLQFERTSTPFFHSILDDDSLDFMEILTPAARTGSTSSGSGSRYNSRRNDSINKVVVPRKSGPRSNENDAEQDDFEDMLRELKQVSVRDGKTETERTPASFSAPYYHAPRRQGNLLHKSELVVLQEGKNLPGKMDNMRKKKTSPSDESWDDEDLLSKVSSTSSSSSEEATDNYSDIGENYTNKNKKNSAGKRKDLLALYDADDAEEMLWEDDLVEARQRKKTVAQQVLGADSEIVVPSLSSPSASAPSGSSTASRATPTVEDQEVLERSGLLANLFQLPFKDILQVESEKQRKAGNFYTFNAAGVTSGRDVVGPSRPAVGGQGDGPYEDSKLAQEEVRQQVVKPGAAAHAEFEPADSTEERTWNLLSQMAPNTALDMFAMELHEAAASISASEGEHGARSYPPRDFCSEDEQRSYYGNNDEKQNAEQEQTSSSPSSPEGPLSRSSASGKSGSESKGHQRGDWKRTPLKSSATPFSPVSSSSSAPSSQAPAGAAKLDAAQDRLSGVAQQAAASASARSNKGTSNNYKPPPRDNYWWDSYKTNYYRNLHFLKKRNQVFSAFPSAVLYPPHAMDPTYGSFTPASFYQEHQQLHSAHNYNSPGSTLYSPSDFVLNVDRTRKKRSWKNGANKHQTSSAADETSGASTRGGSTYTATPTSRSSKGASSSSYAPQAYCPPPPCPCPNPVPHVEAPDCEAACEVPDCDAPTPSPGSPEQESEEVRRAGRSYGATNNAEWFHPQWDEIDAGGSAGYNMHSNMFYYFPPGAIADAEQARRHLQAAQQAEEHAKSAKFGYYIPNQMQKAKKVVGDSGAGGGSSPSLVLTSSSIKNSGDTKAPPPGVFHHPTAEVGGPRTISTAAMDDKDASAGPQPRKREEEIASMAMEDIYDHSSKNAGDVEVKDFNWDKFSDGDVEREGEVQRTKGNSSNPAQLDSLSPPIKAAAASVGRGSQHQSTAGQADENYKSSGRDMKHAPKEAVIHLRGPPSRLQKLLKQKEEYYKQIKLLKEQDQKAGKDLQQQEEDHHDAVKATGKAAAAAGDDANASRPLEVKSDQAEVHTTLATPPRTKWRPKNVPRPAEQHVVDRTSSSILSTKSAVPIAGSFSAYSSTPATRGAAAFPKQRVWVPAGTAAAAAADAAERIEMRQQAGGGAWSSQQQATSSSGSNKMTGKKMSTSSGSSTTYNNFASSRSLENRAWEAVAPGTRPNSSKRRAARLASSASSSTSDETVSYPWTITRTPDGRTIWEEDESQSRPQQKSSASRTWKSAAVMNYAPGTVSYYKKRN
ncbi:unnamed protein product [Amoebophrya sp. A120]|nr:unnamed protein product [Amoebophrya sp. A120]|eukprot:GSA120T00010556001.1